MTPTDRPTDTTDVAPTCDVCDRPIVGEVYEGRTGNWLDRRDMVCVMLACADHAGEVAAHTRAWRECWLATEGADFGYTTLS